MLVLAFDASTPLTTVAVGEVEGEERRILAEISSTAGASRTLLEGIRFTLELSGRRIEDLGRLIAGVGPGTFTGIRIACATARSLSLSTGVPLSASSTLAALATPALGVYGEVLAVLDAKRGEVFARRFPDGPMRCVRPRELAEEASLVVGDGAVRYRGKLSHLGRIPPDGSPLHRVTAAGHILVADMEVVESDALVPIYLREPDAKVRKDLNPWSRR